MVRKKFLVVLALGFFALPVLYSAQAEQGALSSVQAKREQMNASSEKLGGGTNLKSIASPKKGGTSFTGFPTGTLPGDGGSSGGASAGAGGEPQQALSPTGRVVLSGSPIESVLSNLPLGTPLDKICAVADHMGYRVSSLRYSISALDAPYSCVLTQGKKKIATLLLNRSLKLATVQ